MYHLTRATVTLIGVGIGGFLIWLSTQFAHHTNGGYWAAMGVIAGAGLVMALSQLLGGWTKWGVPRLSAGVFLLAFIPTLIAAGWVLLAGQPHGNWFFDHTNRWSSDIHIRGLVNDLKQYLPLLAFGIGLVFGFSFDTTGPRRAVAAPPAERGRAAPLDRRAADEPLTADRGADGTDRPATSRDEAYVGSQTRAGSATAPQRDTAPPPDETR